MKYKLSPWAADEVDKAAAYYDGQRQGLGDDFLSEYAKTVKRIVDSPDACAFISKPARLCAFERFKYGIVYFVRDDLIHIVAVMHLHRRPGYWKSRLKKMD